MSFEAIDDVQLIKNCQQELPYVVTSFEELVRRYQSPLFAMCRRYLSVESDAEDATQEIFMKVFHTLANFEHRSTFKTWLFSIAINHCKTILSNNKKQQERYVNDDEITFNTADDGRDSEQQFESDDEKNCVQRVIGMMKSVERDLILLRFTSDLSLDEIANTLGKQLSATKMSFYRALEKFKTLHERHCT